MIVLALNTCLAACDGTIAVHREDGSVEILASRLEEMRRGQDGRLPGFVEDLCGEASVTLSDMDRFAVVTGPGSFTGIRIGIAFMRGLALAFDTPLVGLTSLEAGSGFDAEGLAGLPAQTRPPEKTYWVQPIRDGLGTERVTEQAEEALDVAALTIISPRADLAARKAFAVSPETHPARPVYARAPDAALLKPRNA